RLSVMLPCIEEQRKIAAFLLTFDKKITAEKQVLSDLQEMKKGLLQQMFV
ncbi:MAG: restriction endonuclease subunit S, partial [Selenomonadaceae bacterium]|nr:restriction endonuclease subunit S [Selenomonadaceae bacterium]